MADARLAALPLGIQDPTAAVIGQIRGEITDLRTRVRALETAPTVQVVGGTPTQGSRDGTLAVDSGASKLWVRRNGTWQYTTLT